MCMYVQMYCNVHVHACMSIHTATPNKPEIDEYTPSPHYVQPRDQIVMSAVATTTTANAHATWHYGNITFKDHIREDPFCTVIF